MPDRTLLIGSGNRDKARELAAILDETPWIVQCLADLEDIEPPTEDGEAFEDNALLKASYYGAAFGLPCVADDSGLEVDVLDGAPGVWSARYAGEGCFYADNNAKLLRELQGWRDPDARRSRFVCCAAYVDPDGRRFVDRGSVEGRIALEPRGSEGFGYDPIFIPDGWEETFAELPQEIKHAISHRGRAFAKLKAFLETLY